MPTHIELNSRYNKVTYFTPCGDLLDAVFEVVPATDGSTTTQALQDQGGHPYVLYSYGGVLHDVNGDDVGVVVDSCEVHRCYDCFPTHVWQPSCECMFSDESTDTHLRRIWEILREPGISFQLRYENLVTIMDREEVVLPSGVGDSLADIMDQVLNDEIMVSRDVPRDEWERLSCMVANA